MTIYDKALDSVRKGKGFQINLKKKSLKVGKALLIDEGRWEGDLGQDRETDGVTPIDTLRQLFKEFHHSIPSQEDDKHPSRYFKALREHELSTDDLLYGQTRHLAQFRLEATLLILILTGQLTWNSPGWFLQDSEQKELILLKEWFVC